MSLNAFRFVTLFSAVSFSLIGLFVYLKDRNSPLHRTFGIYVSLCALWSFGFFLTMFSRMPYQAALWSSRVSHFFGGLTAIVFMHFVRRFLFSEPLPRIKPIHYWFAIATGVGCLTPWLITDLPPKLFFPYYPEPGPFYLFLLASFFYTYLASFGLLYRTYRDKTVEHDKRMQSLVILIGVFLAWTNVATLFLPIYNVPVIPQLSLFPILGISAVYAIIRYRFLDIQIILRRSLVYSLLIALITAMYLVMVLVMEHWFQGFLGYRSVFATLFVAFLIAVCFNPLRDRIQAFVDRALFSATPVELAVQREQLLEEVRKSDQMKAVATLAAGLAHEIKNPLTSIKTFTEHLNAKHDDPTFREKFQKIVGGEVDRINMIVQQLLEFAKPVPPKLIPLQVPKLLNETLELLNGELLSHQVQVTKSFFQSTAVLADPQQLKQVFLNLLLNSLQAMNGSGRITLTTFPRNGELIIVLEDSGCGIAPEDLKRLGEPFFSTKPTGTGLGLAVVQSIIREHQGKFQITSQVGKGTRAEIHIPLASA